MSPTPPAMSVRSLSWWRATSSARSSPGSTSCASSPMSSRPSAWSLWPARRSISIAAWREADPMTPLSTLEDIERLYAARGGLSYGEGVTQTEHALQCAGLAQAAGASPSLVAAALLHDIGHLLQHEQEAAEFSVDDRHEAAGAEALAGLFGEAVWRPVALHVAAKRYLCRVEPGY